MADLLLALLEAAKSLFEHAMKDKLFNMVPLVPLGLFSGHFLWML